MIFSTHIREEEFVGHLLCEDALTQEQLNHLQTCPECLQLCSGIKAVIADVSSEPTVYPNPARMWKSIQSRLEPDSALRVSTRSFWAWPSLSITAIAAVLIFSAGDFVWLSVIQHSRRVSATITHGFAPSSRSRQNDSLADADRLLTQLSHSSDSSVYISPELKLDVQLQLSRNAADVQSASAAGKAGEAKVLTDAGMVLMAVNANRPNSAHESPTIAIASEIDDVLTDIRIVEQNQNGIPAQSQERN